MSVRSGFSWASGTAWVALIAIGIYLVYAATHTKVDNENYAKGATHIETTYAPVQQNYPLSIPGCGRFLTVETPSGMKTVDLDRKAKVCPTTKPLK